jgi:histidine triad (HIT) family protein
MAYAYDDQNIFAKILRNEIPNDTVYESDHALAFRDIAPVASTHVLVIPKGAYVSMDHFTQEATDAELVEFMRAIGEVCKLEGVSNDGFRAIANTGTHGVQDVPHLHVHIIGGRPLGRMISPAG